MHKTFASDDVMIFELASLPSHFVKMAEFDLTTRMGQYLDRHLVFPLLEFLSVKKVNNLCLSLVSCIHLDHLFVVINE